jgi:hypothetical protein
MGKRGPQLLQLGAPPLRTTVTKEPRIVVNLRQLVACVAGSCAVQAHALPNQGCQTTGEAVLKLLQQMNVRVSSGGGGGGGMERDTNQVRLQPNYPPESRLPLRLTTTAG